MNAGLMAEAAVQLQEGINLVFTVGALRMAVENEWGGRDSLQKSQQLGQHLFHRLTQSKEDMLDEFMLSLNTEIGDGSVEEIAEKLMVMHEECLEGNFDSIKRLKETKAPNVSYNRQAGSNNDDSDSDDDDDEDDNNDDTGEGNSLETEMEVDAPECQLSLNQQSSTANEPSPEQAPEIVDGWTVVASRHSRGRWN
ncbi:UNVERIFIED_CONTAM: hypothetical protein Sradi_3402100 [Sesamum radiatum]|uniref:Pre-rRNA-processing protein TSR2 homolog n=1 Tax=Sesamum radiatum TaxID=300843 RepID=A0AAW2R4T4_SESRA